MDTFHSRWLVYQRRNYQVIDQDLFQTGCFWHNSMAAMMCEKSILVAIGGLASEDIDH